MRRVAEGLKFIVLLVTALVAGCGGGSGGGDGIRVESFSATGASPVGLNEPLVFTFSGPVLDSSVREGAVLIRTGPNGQVSARGELVRGTYRDGVVDRSRKSVVTFIPAVPNRVDLTDAGLQPGTRYEVRLPAGRAADGVRSRDRNPLSREYRSEFVTASNGAAALFSDSASPGSPDVVGISPANGADSVVETTSVRITFSEPLLPSTVLAGDPAAPSIALLNISTAPPRSVEVSRSLAQTSESATVTLNPVEPLLGGMMYRVVVSERVTDLAGNPVAPFVSSFSTEGNGVIEHVFLEDFETNLQEDELLTTANWNNRRDTLSGGFPGKLTAVREAGDGPVGPPPSHGSTAVSTWFNTFRDSPLFGLPTEEYTLNGGTIVIEYQSTHEDRETWGDDPDLDPDAMSDWVPGSEIGTISNRKWIRFRVRFTVPDDHPPGAPLPEVDLVTVPITF